MKSGQPSLSILEAIYHVKHDIAPIVAQTFAQGLAETRMVKNSVGAYTIAAYKLGEINLNEDIADTTLFLRQITAAIYPPANGLD